MPRSPIFFPTGSRLRAIFPMLDIEIPALFPFIEHTAARLACGDTLATAALSAKCAYPQAAYAFRWGNSESEIEDSFGLDDRIAYFEEPLPSRIVFSALPGRLSLKLDPRRANDVRSLLGRCASGRWNAQEIRTPLAATTRGLFDLLLKHGFLVEGAPLLPRLNVPSPGITRLQHANVLYRGREAGIMIDPHFHSHSEDENVWETFSWSQLEGLVDAVLISHSHLDHWHVSTLMLFPRDMLFIVPKVSRSTFLCQDFASTLRALGFTRVIEAGWFDSPIVVGDLEVHTLPFFGEQPLLSEAPRNADLRNHGNTYVVRHDSYSSWVLIDSGRDSAGAMTSVAHDVRSRLGRIDVVVCTLRNFGLYFPECNTDYWLAFTTDQMRRFATMANDVVSLGPAGVAEICAIVGARTFLPYAHWWGEIGAQLPREPALLAELKKHLVALGVNTTIVDWRIGDAFPT